MSSGIYINSNSLFSFLISSCIEKEKRNYYKAFKVATDPLEFGCLNESVKIIANILVNQLTIAIKELEAKKENIDNICRVKEFTKSENKIYSLLAEASILMFF